MRKEEEHEHEHDVVMPGFRFHPTEEELIEFYLRRKVEGKRFNVELVTFLDLYSYDPWELPAMAAIGEKEWFFYVPRDRKYRNGDRPNRVTTSGYWKATGADRTIKSDNLVRSIGLKKTLVFYTGKAPKGIRTSWIMNEYRLPHHETEKSQRVEISLCRIYKRPGVEDHPSIPGSFPTKTTSSSSASSSNFKKKDKNNNIVIPNFHSSMERSFQAQEGHINFHLDEHENSETSGSSTIETGKTNKGISNNNIFHDYNTSFAPMNPPLDLQVGSSSPNCNPIFTNLPSSNLVHISDHSVDDLHKLVNFQQIPLGHHPNHQIHQTVCPDRYWEWSMVADQGKRDYINSFK